MPIIAGIYCIISPSNSWYIGQSKNIHRRWSEYKTGKKMHNEGRRKLSETRKREKIGAKPVSQYSLDGVWIKDFDSGKDAALEVGIHNTHVTACCKRKRKYTHGFIFRYKGDDI